MSFWRRADVQEANIVGLCGTWTGARGAWTACMRSALDEEKSLGLVGDAGSVQKSRRPDAAIGAVDETLFCLFCS